MINYGWARVFPHRGPWLVYRIPPRPLIMAAHGDDVITNLFLNARQQLLCFVSTVEGGKEERAAQRQYDAQMRAATAEHRP